MVYLASQFLLSAVGWTAVAACVTAAVAIVAAIIGLSQLSEARRLRKEQAQPYVVVFTDGSGTDPRHFDFVVKNFGTTAATDVHLSFSEPLASAVLAPDHSPLKVPEVFPVLVPSQEWRTFWDFTPKLDEAKDLPRSYTAKVNYSDPRGKDRFSFEFVIDLQTLIDRGFVTIYDIHDGARALIEIRELLG